MIKIRNALAAGAMGASALVVPVTMPAQLAHAGTVAAHTSITPALASAAEPCRHRGCHRRGVPPGENGLDDDLDDGGVPGGAGGGTGIDD